MISEIKLLSKKNQKQRKSSRFKKKKDQNDLVKILINSLLNYF